MMAHGASLAGLVLSFIACFMLLVIAPLHALHRATCVDACKCCSLHDQLIDATQPALESLMDSG